MNGTRSWLWIAGCALFSCSLLACDRWSWGDFSWGDRELQRPPERRVFIALERDFADFRAWGSLPVTILPARGNTHAQGLHRVFINTLPPAGTAAFPIGTLIVKEVHAVEPDQNRLFAMAKRGADFNAQGARGWEWFELVERSDGTPGILWRGIDAPSGEQYSADPHGTCNNCHQLAEENDCVQSPGLSLAPDSRPAASGAPPSERGGRLPPLGGRSAGVAPLDHL